jgi:hypothetical protein
MCEDLKQEVVSLCKELVKNEVDLSKIVPHAAFAVRGVALSKLSDEVTEQGLLLMISQLEARVPEKQRREVLTKLVEQLRTAKLRMDFTKDRIKDRIQPEGKERVVIPFKSFCKRKGEW